MKNISKEEIIRLAWELFLKQYAVGRTTTESADAAIDAIKAAETFVTLASSIAVTDAGIEFK